MSRRKATTDENAEVKTEKQIESEQNVDPIQKKEETKEDLEHTKLLLEIEDLRKKW